MELEFKQDESMLWLPEDMRQYAFSGREIMSVEVPPAHWIIPGFLVEGFTVLLARPKVGKSTMSLDWAMGVAAGDNLMGLPKYEAVQGRTLYVSVDNPKINDFQENMLARAGSKGIPELFTASLDLPRMTEDGGGGLDMIKRFMDKSPEQVQLVIIDVLQKFLPEYTEDAGAYQKLQKYLPHVVKVANDYNIALVGLMHMNKDNNTADWINGAYGNVAIVAEAHNILGLLERPDGKRIIRMKGRNTNAGPFLTEYHHETRSITVSEDDGGSEALEEIRTRLSKGGFTARPTTAMEAMEWILKSIPECEDMSSSQATDAAAELDINPSTARGALRSLRIAKKIDLEHYDKTERYRIERCDTAAA